MRISEFRELVDNMPFSYQAFTSKRSTWVKHIRGDNSIGKALQSIFSISEDTTLSRNDLRRLATEPDLTLFVMATIIWGYPRGMRGNNVANLTNNLEQLTELLSTARRQPVMDWYTHYRAVKPIAGIGLSTYTKLLSFLSVQVHGHSALILDERIITIANHGVFEELAPILDLSAHNAVSHYPQYLSCIHSLAKELAVSAEKIEFFLYEFGLNLKL